MKRLFLAGIPYIVFLTACGHGMTLPNPDQIVSFTFQEACVGLCPIGYTHPLNPNIPKNKAIISKIINWVNSSKEEPQSGNFVGGGFGFSPSSIEMRFRNGDDYHIVLDAQDRVVIAYKPNAKPVRVMSPELQTWLQSNWKTDISDPESMKKSPKITDRFLTNSSFAPLMGP
jgi:hypothetical protein